jgi:hypothetical protein
MVSKVEYPYSGHQSYVEGRVSEVLEPRGCSTWLEDEQDTGDLSMKA